MDESAKMEISVKTLRQLRQYESVLVDLVYGLYLDWAYEVKDLDNAFEYAEKHGFKEFKEYLEDKTIDFFLNDEDIMEMIKWKTGNQ